MEGCTTNSSCLFLGWPKVSMSDDIQSMRVLREANIGHILRQTDYQPRIPLIAVIGDATYTRRHASQSSSASSLDPERIAGEVGYALAKAGYRVLCGGLGGCMEAAAREAQRAVSSSRHLDLELSNDDNSLVTCTSDSVHVSIRIHCGQSSTVIGVLPSQDGITGGANPFVDLPVRTNLNTTRNNVIASAADAVVLVGGGAGTEQEAAAAWSAGRMLLSMVGTGGTADRLAGHRLDDRRRLHGPGDCFIPQKDDIVHQIYSIDELMFVLEKNLHWYRLESVRTQSLATRK